MPEASTSCPHCGRELIADHTESEIIEAVPAEKSTFRPWLVGVGVGILVLVVGGVSFALFSNPATGAAFSERMPANVTAYFALDVG